MFDVAVWGTVGQWISGIASSGALVVGASVFAVDLYRKWRAQASSVVAWYATSDKGVKIFVRNYSDEPIFNYGIVVQPKTRSEVNDLIIANRTRPIPHRNLPPASHESDEFFAVLHLARDGKDGDSGDLDFVLGPGEANSYDARVDYCDRAYDFYVFFGDAYGRRWVRDARSNKLLRRREAREIHPAQSKLRKIFDHM